MRNQVGFCEFYHIVTVCMSDQCGSVFSLVDVWRYTNQLSSLRVRVVSVTYADVAYEYRPLTLIDVNIWKRKYVIGLCCKIQVIKCFEGTILFGSCTCTVYICTKAREYELTLTCRFLSSRTNQAVNAMFFSIEFHYKQLSTFAVSCETCKYMYTFSWNDTLESVLNTKNFFITCATTAGNKQRIYQTRWGETGMKCGSWRTCRL